LGILASGASAALIQPVLTNNGANWDAIFGNNVVLGSFSDIFDVIVPMNGSGLGASVVSDSNVNITSFALVDATTSTTLASGVAGNISSLNYVGLLDVTHSYQIQVNGELKDVRESGSYSGNIQLSSVPEPETYVMWLVGLGITKLYLAAKKG
jgi:hypothetical protein